MEILKMAKRIAWLGLKKAAPKLHAERKVRKIRASKSEHELKLLPCLCDNRKVSLDIGAAEGLYTFNMAELCDHCIAFEANPSQASKLDTMARLLRKNVTVHSIGLSDKAGVAELRMLPNDLGRSTIEISNSLPTDSVNKTKTMKVRVQKLDAFGYTNVGFIKIDVEGHELSVLKGAEATLKKHLPSILIEIEERHKRNSIKEVTSYLRRMEYCCFFVFDDIIRPISEFKLSFHQNTANIGSYDNQYGQFGIYTNNFIFIQKTQVPLFLAKAQRLLYNP